MHFEISYFTLFYLSELQYLQAVFAEKGTMSGNFKNRLSLQFGYLCFVYVI